MAPAAACVTIYHAGDPGAGRRTRVLRPAALVQMGAAMYQSYRRMPRLPRAAAPGGRLCAVALLLGVLALGGCTHLAGQVFDARTKAPLSGVTFTIGRPDSFAVYGRHKVDSQGRFDFSIAPTDASFIYLWDGQGDPELHAEHIDQSTFSDHMKVYYDTSRGDW